MSCAAKWLLDELDVEAPNGLQPFGRGLQVPCPVDVEAKRDIRPDRRPDRPHAFDEHLGLAFGAGLDLERDEARIRPTAAPPPPLRRGRVTGAWHSRRRHRRRLRPVTGGSRSSPAPSIAAASARPGAPCCSRSASEGRPSAAPSTASRTSASRIVSATSPFAGSSTASPSPTRPSSSTSRRIHASRSTHIPVAVGNGRRNGIRTRSATSARPVMRSRRRSRARPRTRDRG